jgi:hypothetical protein
MKELLITGSSGLIGSEVCVHFAKLGWKIHGVDNNQRAAFFGPEGDTRWNQHQLQEAIAGFTHHELNIRDRKGILWLLDTVRPYAILRTGAKPSDTAIFPSFLQEIALSLSWRKSRSGNRSAVCLQGESDGVMRQLHRRKRLSAPMQNGARQIRNDMGKSAVN